MKNLKHKCRVALEQAEALFRAHPYMTILGVLAIAALIALLRRPETIFQAQFWAEDGRYWYAEAYNNGLSTLFEPYAGYFVIVYRLVAYAALALPLHFAPHFFNLAALAIQLLPIIILCSGRLAFIQKRWIGVALSLLYISVPNSAEVFTNLTNIQWHLGVASFLILLASPSKNIVWRIYDYAVLIATGFSGPLVVILAPLAAWIWWKHKTPYHRNRLILLILLSLVQAASILIFSGEGRVGAATNVDIVYFAQMIVGQVMTGGLLGQVSVNMMYNSPFLLFWLFVGGMATVGYVLWRGPMWLKLANVYSGLLIVAMLASLKPVPGFDPWQGLTNPGGGQRYWYIPILVWIATLIWIAFHAPLRFLRPIAFTALGLLLLVGIPTDWRIHPWPYQHFRAYALQFEQAPPGTTMHIPVNPGWEMILIKK